MKDLFHQRQWAESVRLYSGLLDYNERYKLILSLSEKDILLAAECKNIVAADEFEIELELIKIAIKNAKNFTKISTSTSGFLALSELNRHDEISRIFSSVKSFHGVHSEVVMNFVSSGKEIQIATLLQILSEVSRKLLIRALDKINEMNIYFSSTSFAIASKLVVDNYDRKDYFIVGKIVCAFRTTFNVTTPKLLLDSLLKKQQVSNADYISQVFKYKPEDIDQFIKLLETYIEDKASEKIIFSLISLFENWGYSIQSDRLAILFSKHHNPKLKNKFFDNYGDLDPEILRNIIESNLQQGNKSTVEFAFHLIKENELFDSFPLNEIIEILLSRHTVPRISLAINIIQEYSIGHVYSKSLILLWLINLDISQSYRYVIDYISNHVEETERESLFLKLITILLDDYKARKAIRQIVSNNLNTLVSYQDIKIGEVYFGYVLGYFKGHYSILIGDNIRVSFIVKGKRLKVNSVIKIKITGFDDNGKAKFEIVRKDITKILSRKYVYQGIFIGQIINATISEIENQRIIVNLTNTLQGEIHISELGFEYINDLSKQYKIGQQVKSVVIGFRGRFVKVQLSVKALLPLPNTQSNSLSDWSKRKLDDTIRILENRLNS